MKIVLVLEYLPIIEDFQDLIFPPLISCIDVKELGVSIFLVQPLISRVLFPIYRPLADVIL